MMEAWLDWEILIFSAIATKVLDDLMVALGSSDILGEGNTFIPLHGQSVGEGTSRKGVI